MAAQTRSIKRCVEKSLVAGLLLLAWCQATVVEGAKLPKWSKIDQVVTQHLREERKRQPFDLISRQDIEPIFSKLSKAGWTLTQTQKKSLIERMLPEGDALIRLARTPDGKRSLQPLVNQPNALDRLDRTMRLPGGEATLRDLSGWSDQGRMLKTLATTNEGADLAASLSGTRRDEKFTQPTGRIYTQAHLLNCLRTIYGEAAKKGSSAKKK